MKFLHNKGLLVKGLTSLLLVFGSISIGNAQKHSFEVLANYVLNLPYDIELNNEEAQLMDILKEKQNYEFGIGYQYNLWKGICPSVEVSYGNKDLNFTDLGLFKEYYIRNIYVRENSIRTSLKVSYVGSFYRFTLGYGLSYNSMDFSSGVFASKFQYFNKPVDLSEVDLNATLNQFYTINAQILPRIHDNIRLICGIKYLYNFENVILKDAFVIRHSFVLINSGFLINLSK